MLDTINFIKLVLLCNFIDIVGSWIDKTSCNVEHMRVYFNRETEIVDLALAKQLCEDACFKTKGCLAADLVNYDDYVCYLLEKTCNEHRLLKNDQSYHFKRGSFRSYHFIMHSRNCKIPNFNIHLYFT